MRNLISIVHIHSYKNVRFLKKNTRTVMATEVMASNGFFGYTIGIGSTYFECTTTLLYSPHLISRCQSPFFEKKKSRSKNS